MRIGDPERVREILAADPLRHVALLDVLARDGPGGVTLFADEGAINWVGVHWGAGPLGMTHLVTVHAGRVAGLTEVIDALPRGEGTYELMCPFWAAPALENVFRTEVQGPVSRYVLREAHLAAEHPAQKQVVPFDEVELVAYAFPRAVPGAPHRALVLGEELAAVAVVDALAHGVGRMGVHVSEARRGRGFGGAVARALARALLDEGVTPVGDVPLYDEASVRLAEGLGMTQVETVMRVTAVARPGPT